LHLASEAVSYFTEARICSTRQEAVLLGRKMAAFGLIVQHSGRQFDDAHVSFHVVVDCNFHINLPSGEKFSFAIHYFIKQEGSNRHLHRICLRNEHGAEESSGSTF
jgi:hypothetical protein